jgi:hypothetical protein
MPTINGCGHGGKGSRFRVLPGRPRRHRGRKLPPSLNLREVVRRRRMKTRKRGRQLSLRTLCHTPKFQILECY